MGSLAQSAVFGIEHYPHPASIEVDLLQFRKNLGIVRKHIGKSLYCLPVKANGYGHGLTLIGKTAEEAGVDYLGVSFLQEGMKLRQAGISIPILVFGTVYEEQVSALIDFDLEFTISSKKAADFVARQWKWGNKKYRIHIHLEVETGMQRTGVKCSEAVELLEYLKSLQCFEIIGIYSHFASADNPNDPIALNQIKAFDELLSHSFFQENTLIRHLANSNGTIHFPEVHYDMVRPGMISFGYLPDNAPSSWQGLAPCFSLKAQVSYSKIVEKGEGISYGHTYITQKRTRIVTIPVGFGDGFCRVLANRGSVLIHGKRFPIVGTICMDQFMVDVGDEEVIQGDEVVLIGKQKNEEITLSEIAKIYNTIPSEVLCLFNDRIPRREYSLS